MSIKDTKDDQILDNFCDEKDTILEINRKAGERALEEFWKAYFNASYASRDS